MLIYIVIPCFNSEGYLHQCLSSVLLQEGDFNLHVHIQDGLSKDSTLLIAKQWQALVSENTINGLSKITLTIDSQADEGIYDALAKGFSQIPSTENIIMTWLGSDDLLTNGSLATVSKIFRDHKEISWLTGKSQTIDSNGCLFSPWKKIYFSRYSIIMGLHEGRTFGFIQQEGTFLRYELYQKIGGIDTKYKYAGDFDLWRKFACLENIYSVDVPLGIFRYRQGQTSSNRESYYQEVASIKENNNLIMIYDELNLNNLNEYLYSYSIEKYTTSEDHTIIKEINSYFIIKQGFSSQMDSLPEKGIFAPYYWTLGKQSVFSLDVFGLPIVYSITLKVRNFHSNQTLTIYNNQKKSLSIFKLHDNFNQIQFVTFSCDFASGDTTLILELTQALESSPEQEPLGILLESLHFLPIKYLLT